MSYEVILIILLVGEFAHCKKKTTTSAPVGVWGAWGSWDENCSMTCGIGVRRRIRTCSYEGRHKERRCQGPQGQMKNCDTKITCPVDGGWSPWEAEECTVTCGGGIGKQRRECNNPKPMFNGKKCEGSKREEGNCNTHKCADQVYTLSPSTSQAVKDAIDKGHFNFEKAVGDNVRIPCNPTVVSNIYKEYPESSLTWTKNGKILKLDKERMKVNPTELQLSELKPEDNGVYVCSIHYVPKVAKPVTVAAVTVLSLEPSVRIPAEEKLRLVCHGAQLGKIYKNVTQVWYHNKKIFKDFKKESPVENNVYYIDEVKPNMTGTWACEITDPISGKKWKTNALTLKVLPAIPRYVKFLSDRNLLLTVGIVIFLILMSTGTYFAYAITKTRAEYMKDFEKWSLIAKEEEIKAGGLPDWAKSSSLTPATSESSTEDE